MDTIDWRTQLPPDARQKIINKIMETLKKGLPFSGPEGTNLLRRIASGFEEKVFASAVNQTDYLRKISMKMLTMETKSQNAAGSSAPIPAANNSLPLDPSRRVDNDYSNPSLMNVEPALSTGNMKDNNNWRPSPLNEQPTMENGDWKIQLPFDSRQRIVNKIMETLKKHLPISGPEGTYELRRIASRFEDNVFSSAVSQTDYLRKISMKMLTMETKSQNAAGSPSTIPAANNRLPLDPCRRVDKDYSNPSRTNVEPAVNTGDWRTQLPPDSRHKIIKKLIETLKKHVPHSGQEGISELVRIAISFEELVFNTAINQVDYFGKISSKMQTIEEDR